MGASASVIQEYYKAVDYWADIAGKKDWKLAIWIVGRNDVDLVDKFLEIERSPVGQFDDIFFRFDTPYRGDDDEYAAQLWQEYAGWFDEQAEEKDDMLRRCGTTGCSRRSTAPTRRPSLRRQTCGRRCCASRSAYPVWRMPSSASIFLRNNPGNIPGRNGSDRY